MTLDEFVAQEVERSGKRIFTVAEVEAMVSRWRAVKLAAAAPFAGWLDGPELEQAKSSMRSEVQP